MTTKAIRVKLPPLAAIFVRLLLCAVPIFDTNHVIFVHGQQQPQPQHPPTLQTSLAIITTRRTSHRLLPEGVRKINRSDSFNDSNLSFLDIRGGSNGRIIVSHNKNIRSNTNIPLSEVVVAGEKQKLVQRGGESSREENNNLLILIRILYLTYYGSLGALMPYLPVYYHSLGHGGLIIGMIGAVKPLTTFIVAPIWGMISDFSLNKFNILKLTFAFSMIGQTLVSISHEVHYMIIMTLITAIMNAPVKSLIDSVVMDNLEKYNNSNGNGDARSQYGRLRLWGQLGFGVGSSTVGYLLHQSQAGVFDDGRYDIPTIAPFITSENGEEHPHVEQIRSYANILVKFWNNLKGYKLLFATYAALSIPTWICIQSLERSIHQQKGSSMIVRNKKQSRKAVSTGTEGDRKKQGEGPQVERAHIKEGLNILIHNKNAIIFFFLVFIIGTSSGCIENFAYVRLKEVGGTGKEMGISRAISSAAGAPMFYYSSIIIKKLTTTKDNGQKSSGIEKILLISLLSYVIRFFIYALMKNPYHGLPAEALRGITFAIFWSSSTIYAHQIAPQGLHSTSLILLNAMYGGLGQSLGAIIGGKLQHKLGTIKTFLSVGIFDLLFIIGVLIFKRIHNSNAATSKATAVAVQ